MVLRNVWLANELWDGIDDKTISVLHLNQSYYTSGQDYLFGECERVLKDNGVIVIADIPSNSSLVGETYLRWGAPRRISSLTKDTVFTALLFSPHKSTTLSRFPAWGIDWLEEKELALPAKVTSSFIASVKTVALDFGLRVNGFDTKKQKFTAKRFTSVMPQLVAYPAKEFKREVKMVERLAQPEGIDSIHELFPLRLARFIVGAFAGATGAVLDAGSCGVFGHAVLGAKNDCFVFANESVFAVDRLESLSLGSWKDWTYHEPVVDGFTFFRS